MQQFTLTGIQKCTTTRDRQQHTIEFRTDKGPLELAVSASHLEELITTLEGIEHVASLHQPTKGPLPGENLPMRVAPVEHYHTGTGTLGEMPVVVIGLKYSKVLRWFSFDRAHAEGLSQAIDAEIGKLGTAPNRGRTTRM